MTVKDLLDKRFDGMDEDELLKRFQLDNIERLTNCVPEGACCTCYEVAILDTTLPAAEQQEELNRFLKCQCDLIRPGLYEIVIDSIDLGTISKAYFEVDGDETCIWFFENGDDFARWFPEYAK